MNEEISIDDILEVWIKSIAAKFPETNAELSQIWRNKERSHINLVQLDINEDGPSIYLYPGRAVDEIASGHIDLDIYNPES